MAENHRPCATCGTPNEEDARFCEGCGASLARVCATCGVEARATARFCRGCGAPLDTESARVPGTPDAGPVRKTVTVMFADLAGSTSFEERVDAETAREVIGGYHDLLRSVAQHHRAGVTKYIGDGFMAVWGVPEILPDDAVHAVDAAVELQERFVDLAGRVAETHGVELALRVAVNTGEVVVGAGDADLVGDALNVGARLESECPRGRVVVGEETWRATRGHYGFESLGDVQVKGRTAPVAVYQWVARQAEAADAAPFVGRGDELRRLQSAMDDALSTRTARLVTVIGDPGVGKSRLAAEYASGQRDARVVEARCVLEGTVALGPLVEVLRASDLETDVPPGIPERDRLLRDLDGLASGVPGSVEENFWALRRFIEVLATSQPVVLVLDDIQWADTLLLDFIEHLVEWVKDVSVLVLALARPELRDIRPELVAVSRWASEAVHLGGLDAGATAELAAKVLGTTRLPDELLNRLPSSTGGNPLFVRELIGMLAHDGVLVEEPHGWRLTIDVDAISIPPTIHALLASRLERLEAADRRVLEIASVVGSDFSVGAVRALTNRSAEGIKLSLNRLRRLELAQPSGAYVGDEPVWRFHHVLIRDVAYRRLLKSDRADLHERLADWVAEGGQSVAVDPDEMVARHLEAAYTYRSQLGPRDDQSRDLAVRSARRYAASARRALDRDELVSAGTQAARGAALAASDEALHADLLLIGCEAFLSAGDVTAGAPLVDELESIADDNLAPWATCYRCQFVIYTDPERLLEVEARLHDAIAEFSRRKDPAGLAKAHRVRAGARGRLGRIGDSEIDLFEALIAARESGDHRQITAALGAAPGAALWGPSPVPKAGGRCLDVVRMQRMTTAAPSLEATSLRHLAVLELLRGRPDKARTMLADAHQVVADLGLRHGVMETELFAGIIEMMEGDAVAAEPHFRTALEGLDALGVGADAGQAAAFLARSVLAQGRIDEADRYATESERLAGRNLKTAIAWRAVRAEILAAQSRHADAAAMAREAVAVAAGTDLVLDHAEACLALSRVLASVGDTKGAGVARSDAEALYVAKEVTARVDRIATSDMPSPPGGAEAESSRLALANRASRKIDTAWRAFQSHDIDGALTDFSDQIGYDDHRRFSGVPVKDIAELHTATARAREQFPYTEWVTLAVRGERLELRSIRMWDDAGNESTTFNVFELDEREHIQYWGRFDDDDFESAYRELDERYYAGEGAPFAESGTVATNWTLAVNRADFDTLFGELTAKDFHLENRSRSAFPDRSAPEYRTTLEDLAAMVVSARAWPSVMSWVSPNWCVARCERDAVGKDGEKYAWHFLIAFEFRDGRVASMCEFELDDEHAAFAYVADRLRKSTSRLRINNRASELAQAASQALQAHDVDALRVEPAAHFVYDDRRRITGDPIRDAADLHAATERILDSYPHTEWRTIAVRGDRLEMHWSRLWDDDGNEARTLNVMEFDGAGRLEYFGRFEEDDFGGAYRELDRRYYAGEGAAFAEAGAVGTEWAIAVNDGDYVKAFGELIGPDASFENRSRSAFPDPSIIALGTTYQDLNTVDGRTRTWPSVLCPLSPTVGVARLEQETTGRDGERYTWTWISVTEIQGGRFASACLFELDDEEAAFAYAEERMRASLGRLSVTNASCDILPGFFNALRAHDVDSALGHYADEYEYDDHRRLGGAPVVGRDAMRAAMKRLLEDYSHFEFRVLAVRGQRLHLVWSRLSDDEGNESITYYVDEVDDNGKITYHGRFDEGDFEAAYRELERRYYTGEGAAFAENGLPASDAPRAISQDDLDTLFGNIMSADARVETRSRRAFPDRSASELRAGFEALNTLVTSKRVWNSAVAWISPTCSITRLEREAIGIDGETYRWSMILVTEHRGGLVTSICEFDPDDEDGAFAYVEQRVQAQSSRLAVTNQASETAGRFFDALRARDSERAAACYSEQFVYADRRSLSGDPIAGRDGMRLGVERMLAQFTQYDFRVLAVRGQNLLLAWNCESDADGNTTGGLTVFEAENGLITYHGRFDEDDFNGAYRELDRRYFAGEGAAFAQSGATATDAIMALNTSDFDRLLGELCTPDMRVENRTRSAFPDRSITDLRASFGQLDSMVTSTRSWLSSQYWITPNRAVGRLERDATGDSGEQYAWSRVLTIEFRDGLMASMCEFEVDDEAAAFAYIDEKARQPRSRLALTNRSVESADKLYTAMNARDIDATMETISGEFVYDDRRRLSGDPVNSRAEVRAAFKRVLDHYCRFESRILAVRGDRLHLHWARWSDDSGNEAVHLHVFGVDNDGLQDYEGRFDEDDFEGAYREFEHRYYSGEGAAFALAGAVAADYVLALHRMDLDTLFGELTSPDFRLENRSGSAFNDRSAAELRASFEDLDAMMASQQLRHSVVRWVSPTVMVARFDREGVGHGGERYAWSQIDVGEIRDGWCTRACQFDLEQEEAAFAYAEEWAAQTTNSRLAVTNRSCELTVALNSALHETDIDAVMRCFSNSLVYDDRRRLSGDPIHDHAGFRTAFERICDQYNQFEYRFLAVRGDRLNLSWSRWSDNPGNETAYLHVCEIGDDGLIAYEGRFDEDAFEGAYRELERRFYAGEGASFAEAGAIATEVVTALNRGDFDKVFGELTDPDAPIENRSRLPFPNRSTNMLRASFEDLDTMVASTRIWFSALCWVSNSWGIVRFEREAVGKDGEQYRWTHLVAAEIRNGRIASMCEFEVDDEAAAFAYAEERVRPAENR
ncbi:nuclear transport factor 2 family protein [Mycobacterium barrassiae]|uniref:nuclear transport factor 2 family protein n=1 Tax=Mycobacterium barrassiae TaxID=319709 RepID=UPI0022657F08|nr:nuclear transport factor 2 family protein [Mycobacterium barrassiae]MCV7300101.1 nuclear transport factor 2 family protein [Mycobacterium barrassiae]